jgi:3-oxoacyl-[acyl-carrier protein] reductase
MGSKSLIAVVTGASAGIGRSAALRLAKNHTVLAVARRGTLLDQLADESEPTGCIVPVVADLATRGGVDDVISRASGIGPIGILINNAGGSVPIDREGDDEGWRRSFELQFHTPLRLAEAFLPAKIAAGIWRIVNIGAPLEPPARMNGSTVAKGAMTVWAKILSTEVGRNGITVNTIAPGRILSEQVLERLHPTAEDRQRFAQENIPLGYLGAPEDVAALIEFLISDDARYITGELVHIDGGLRRSAF